MRALLVAVLLSVPLQAQTLDLTLDVGSLFDYTEGAFVTGYSPGALFSAGPLEVTSVFSFRDGHYLEWACAAYVTRTWQDIEWSGGVSRSRQQGWNPDWTWNVSGAYRLWSR